MKPFLVSAFVLCAPLAFGQTLLAEDGESGSLLKSASPPGHWDTYEAVSPNVLQLATEAAHRGQHGLRLDDVVVASGTGDAASLTYDLPALPGHNFYARGWVRLTRIEKPGSPVHWTSISGRDAEGELRDLLSLIFDQMTSNEAALWARGWAQPSNYQYEEDLLPPPAGQGEWLLWEFAFTGVGTRTAQRTVWINGSQAATRTVDLIGITLEGFVLGEGYGDRNFKGAVDFDDIRVSSSPPASTLKVLAPAQAEEAECIQVTVSLHDSAGAAAPAPYDVSVDLVASRGQRALFSDASCDTSLSAAVLPLGQNTQSFYARLQGADSLALEARHPDFLSGASQIELQSSATQDPWKMNLGCGGSRAAVLSLLLPFALRRRRSSPCR